MSKEQLYFESVDGNFCFSLEYWIEQAKEEGQTEITLIEAVPDNNNPDYIWCTASGEVCERSYCKKSECEGYESKSGRGVCSNRGNLYTHGEEVSFKVNAI